MTVIDDDDDDDDDDDVKMCVPLFTVNSAFG